jgi:hypothetical protein
MTLESDIAEQFRKNQWTWNLKGGRTLVPEEEDIEAALDEAARLLYNEEVGAQLEVGRLIIRRLHNGFDVYVYVGQYE